MSRREDGSYATSFSATENLLLFVNTVLSYSIYELYSAIFKSKNFHRLSPKTFFYNEVIHF
jgi:hypothetical protein